MAGLAAAGALAGFGAETVLFESEESPAGHVKDWAKLFPDRRAAPEVTGHLTEALGDAVEKRFGSPVTSVKPIGGVFEVRAQGNDPLLVHAVVMATGFDLFDASRKEEYGYGIYHNVITSAGLEEAFRSGRPLLTSSGKTPGRVALIHCVGSRDEKAGNLYCSKVCCVTAVKQAIEIREQLPECEVFSFYMDLRMFDRHFEEMYIEAQKKWGVTFIRGRLSECAENPDHTLVIKTEDTLAGRPMRITVDLVVLMTGMVPRRSTGPLAASLGLNTGSDGFLLPHDGHFAANATTIPGVFLAGTGKGPAGIAESIADGRSAATAAWKYLNTLEEM